MCALLTAHRPLSLAHPRMHLPVGPAVPSHAELLSELHAREAEMNVVVEPELEAFMKAQVRWGWGRWALVQGIALCRA